MKLCTLTPPLFVVQYNLLISKNGREGCELPEGKRLQRLLEEAAVKLEDTRASYYQAQLNYLEKLPVVNREFDTIVSACEKEIQLGLQRLSEKQVRLRQH